MFLQNFDSFLYDGNMDPLYFDPDVEDNGPALEVYGTDITSLASQGLLEECYGRENELVELMEILVRRQKNNPVLVGDAGVGKTAIIELFATKIVKNLVPFVLAGRSIISLDLARIVAGSRYRGEFELRFQRVLDEVMAQPHIIVFIDEIHNIGGTGSAEGSLDAANILKPVLSRSGFQCIGATTVNEYQRIEKDAALNRRFQPIKVKEPSISDTVQILYGLRPSLESFHNVVILPGAIQLAASLSARYIYDRFLPDKAIDLLDRAAAREVIKMTSITQTSVLSGVVNAALIGISRLKIEAFRRGDIAAEFILQEIENSYRTFLLTWLEDPFNIPTANSPIRPQKLGSEKSLNKEKEEEEKKEREREKERRKKEEEYQFPESRFSIIGGLPDYPIVIPMDSDSDSDSAPIPAPAPAPAPNPNPNPNPNPKAQLMVSGLSNELFLKMRESILTRVDELLFASPNIRYEFYLKNNKNNLSAEKTNEILRTMLDSLTKFDVPKLSLYRISLMLFRVWTSRNQFSGISRDFRNKYVENLINLLKKLEAFTYISQKRIEAIENKHRFLFSSEDFLDEDIEKTSAQDELISEKEAKKIHIYKEFVEDLEPVIRRGIVESLKNSSTYEIHPKDLEHIYALLGFLNTENGKDYLTNLKTPELIRRSHEMGNFSLLKKRITQEDIQVLVSDMTGIPIQSMTAGESQKLLQIEATLHERVIGQEEAITAIAKAIRRSRLGIQNPNRPIASFLFCGPTGVGKTEVTKALATSLFGGEKDMIRFDMSEFMEKFTVSRLIGSPPGYIGYDEGGQLTDAVRRKAYSVVLFDEIEKAHPDILNIMLQILEDGRLTDSQKRLVPFDNTVIIMTSNAASEEIQQIMKEHKDTDEDFIKVINSEKEDKKEDEPEVIEVAGYKFNVAHDPYVGVIKFLQSPIKENFLIDLKDQIHLEFDNSFVPPRTEEKLAKELKKVKSKALIANENRREKDLKDKEKNKILGDLKSAVIECLRGLFLPEFLNRLDDIIVFQPLKFEELRRICDIMIHQVGQRIKDKKIELFVDEKIKMKMTREGYSKIFGARPLRRLVTKYIEDNISLNLLQHPLYNKSRRIEIILNIDEEVEVKYADLEPVIPSSKENENDIRANNILLASYGEDTTSVRLRQDNNAMGQKPVEIKEMKPPSIDVSA